MLENVYYMRLTQLTGYEVLTTSVQAFNKTMINKLLSKHLQQYVNREGSPNQIVSLDNHGSGHPQFTWTRFKRFFCAAITACLIINEIRSWMMGVQSQVVSFSTFGVMILKFNLFIWDAIMKCSLWAFVFSVSVMYRTLTCLNEFNISIKLQIYNIL